MPNQYKNKVVFGNQTLIDITDTTAVAGDVAAGKYFYLASGKRVEGTAASGQGMVVVETPDEHGGTIVTITGEEVKLQSKTVTPTKSSQTVQPDTGYTGFATVTVEPIPAKYIEPTGTKQINQNGSGIDVAAYAKVDVNVPPPEISLQTKEVTPTKSTQNVTADSTYDGLSTVTVNPIPAQYIITTDANATASDILSGKSAYVNGSKLNGSLVIQHYYTGTDVPSASLGANGDIYLRTGA